MPVAGWRHVTDTLPISLSLGPAKDRFADGHGRHGPTACEGHALVPVDNHIKDVGFARAGGPLQGRGQIAGFFDLLTYSATGLGPQGKVGIVELALLVYLEGGGDLLAIEVGSLQSLDGAPTVVVEH